MLSRRLFKRELTAALVVSGRLFGSESTAAQVLSGRLFERESTAALVSSGQLFGRESTAALKWSALWKRGVTTIGSSEERTPFNKSDGSRYPETFRYVELSVSSVFDVSRTGTEKQFVG